MLDARSRGSPITLGELIEEMLEFGLDVHTAEKLAPALLPLINDPRGLKGALLIKEPWICEKIGLCPRH